MTLDAGPSVASPALLGTTVTWDAAVPDMLPGSVWYRYRVRGPRDADFRIVRDFSPQTSFQWTPALSDGNYEVEITARNIETGELAVDVQSFPLYSFGSGWPAIQPTKNALVYLYSGPGCKLGDRMTVAFESRSRGERTTTSAQTCDGRGMHHYLAGLRANTEYAVQHTIESGDGTRTLGPVLSFSTGALPFDPPPTVVRQKVPDSEPQSLLFQNRLFDWSVVTDADGEVVWYIAETLPYLTRPVNGGYFYAAIEQHHRNDEDQLLRMYDLAGNVVWETNGARINEQLRALGRATITSFHHEVRSLPDRKIMVIAATERLLEDVQGAGQVSVLGDMILVLDENLEVVWTWDAFDHLDPHRRAQLESTETCVPGGGGCPRFTLAPTSRDWTHGNSLSLAPDGNIIYSARHQNWVLKLNYANGAGDGHVIWKLGKDGDFGIASSETEPWFSHQHDANYIAGEGGTYWLMVYDNGNNRAAEDSNAHSRGLLYELDEVARTARLVKNFDLGGYAVALGSAQRLLNGNFLFNVGLLMPSGASYVLEISPEGELVSRYDIGTAHYRSQRIRDLYTWQ